MKIVINIPEQIYTDIKCGITNGSYDMWLAVAEGQPLSEVINDGSHSTNQRRGTNLDVIRAMSADELAEFIEDLAEFDNPNHEWRCKLCPALPFESWKDWLERRATIHE